MRKKMDIGRASSHSMGPLTLCMASPHKGHLADRLDRLSHAKPKSRMMRGLAGTALLAMAALSAPYTFAGTEPSSEPATASKRVEKSVFRFSEAEKWTEDGTLKIRSGGAYEIISENGVLTAYQLSDDGKTRQQLPVNKTVDGVYELIRQNGEVVTFNPSDYPAPPTPPTPPTFPGQDGQLANKQIRIVTSIDGFEGCLLYTSPSPRDQRGSRMPSSA